MDIHAPDIQVTEADLERAELLLEAYMFPNRAQTDGEKAAMRRAARLQAEHDATLSREIPNLPSTVRSFQIGHFSMSMDCPGSAVTKASVCPSAYALLLREGLLYRGVEGRMQVSTSAPGTPPVPPPPPPPAPGAPPLRPGVRTGSRDAWLPHRKREKGNPPPRGIAPQGTPPLPGLPRNVRAGEERGHAAADAAWEDLPHPPVSP